MKFLPCELRVPEFGLYRLDKGAWQVCRVFVGRPRGDHRALCKPHIEQAPHQRDMARGCRGDDLLTLAKPQTEQQIIPALRRPLVTDRPFPDLIAPGMRVLRAAQAVGLGCRIQERLRAAWEAQAPQGRLEHRHRFRRAAGQNPALAFDHDGARLCERTRNQGDTGGGIVFRNRADPFGPGACLAEATTGHDQPVAPVAGWRQLFGPGEEGPVMAERRLLALVEPVGQPLEVFLAGFGKPVALVRIHELPSRLFPSALSS